MQAARRDPGDDAGGGLGPEPVGRARRGLPEALGRVVALALLCVAWAASAAAQAPPAEPRAVPSTAELSGGSFDAGGWRPAGPAGVAPAIALAVDSRRADHVYLATRDGVYMSRDEGRTWAMTALPGLVAFAPHPVQAGLLFAVTAHEDGRLRAWRSDDRGATWRPGADTGPRTGQDRPRPTAVDLALDPSRPDRLWVGAVLTPAPGDEGAAPVARLWSSRDGGDSLEPVPLPAGGDSEGTAVPAALVLAALDDGTLLAATGAGLFRRPAGGEGWQPSGDGLEGPAGAALPSVTVGHLAAGGGEGRVLYAAVTAPSPGDPDGPGAPSRIYRSADGGARWIPFGIGLPDGPLHALAPHPRRRSEVAVAVAGAGIYRSRGDAWTAVTPGLPPSAEPALLAIAPGRREVLWAVTTGGELYRWTPPQPGCTEDSETLCLAGRFRIDVAPASGTTATWGAHAVPWTKDGGWFWFSDPEEPEVVVRATVDTAVAPGAPGVWTVYAASLSSRPFELRVQDVASGLGESLVTGEGGGGEATLVATFPAALSETDGDLWFATLPEGDCGGDSIDLCLHQGRFEVAVDWRDGDGAAGAAIGDRLTEAAGWFRFLHPGEPELVVKVLDGRRANGHWQVAFASLSELGFEMTVTDRRSGEVVVYEVGAGAPASHLDPTAIPAAAASPGSASTP